MLLKNAVSLIGQYHSYDFYCVFQTLEKWEQLLCRGDRPALLQEHTMVAYKVKQHLVVLN